VVAIALGTRYLAQQFRERALEVTERDLNNTAFSPPRPAADIRKMLAASAADVEDAA
jgi:hypothetical protein